MQLVNQTQSSAILVPDWSATGEPQTTLIIKHSWQLQFDGELIPVAAKPVATTEQYLGEEGRSSLLSTDESVPFKSGGEIWLQGAVKPYVANRTVMDLNLTVQQADCYVIDKTIRWYGQRQWQRGLLGELMSKPELLQPTAMIYELAYGGTDCYQNPIGIGAEKTTKALPQFEDPNLLLQRPGQSRQPSCFAARPSAWSADQWPEPDPERLQAGLYPYTAVLPDNIYQFAPHDQRSGVAWQGGEIIKLTGFGVFAEQESVSLCVPAMNMTMQYGQPDQLKTVQLQQADTLWFDLDSAQLHALQRVALPRVSERETWVIIAG